MFTSLETYEQFIYQLPGHYPIVTTSTLVLIMKHHRVPAPGLSFTQPNLPFLIREVEQLL